MDAQCNALCPFEFNLFTNNTASGFWSSSFNFLRLPHSAKEQSVSKSFSSVGDNGVKFSGSMSGLLSRGDNSDNGDIMGIGRDALLFFEETREIFLDFGFLSDESKVSVDEAVSLKSRVERGIGRGDNNSRGVLSLSKMVKLRTKKRRKKGGYYLISKKLGCLLS